MTIAIKFGDNNDVRSVSGVIYIDAVTNYSKNMGGKTAQHPIEAGASIVDHYIADNRTFRVQGVLSSVDFSSLPNMVRIEGETPINSNGVPSDVSVGTTGSGLYSLLPDVVTQFLGVRRPEVSVDMSERSNYRTEVEGMLEEILHGLYYNEERDKWENRMTLVTLFEMGVGTSTPENIIEDLVITGFNITEDSESGDAMFFDMSLEKVTFVTLEKAEAPSPPKGTKASRTTAEQKKTGTQTGEVEKADGTVPKENAMDIGRKVINPPQNSE